MPFLLQRLPALAFGLALLLAAALQPALAQYKWKDSRGQTHVSDQPPPRDIPDKNVLQRPTPRPAAAEATAAAPPASATGSRLVAGERQDPELEQRRSRAEAEAKARAQADEQRASAQRAENCRRASQHLATLSAGTRLVRSNEPGERVVMDDAMRASEMAQARGVMASDCR